MIVKLKQGNRTLVLDDVQLLVVEDASGNPVSVAAPYGPAGCFVVSSIDAGEDKFNRVLKGLNIDKTVICVDLKDSLKPAESLPTLVRP